LPQIVLSCKNIEGGDGDKPHGDREKQYGNVAGMEMGCGWRKLSAGWERNVDDCHHCHS